MHIYNANMIIYHTSYPIFFLQIPHNIVPPNFLLFHFYFFTPLRPIIAAYMCAGVGHPLEHGKSTSGHILKEGLYGSQQLSTTSR